MVLVLVMLVLILTIDASHGYGNPSHVKKMYLRRDSGYSAVITGVFMIIPIIMVAMVSSRIVVIYSSSPINGY